MMALLGGPREVLAFVPDRLCYLSRYIKVSLERRVDSVAMLLPDATSFCHRIILPVLGDRSGEVSLDGVAVELPLRLGPGQIRIGELKVRLDVALVRYVPGALSIPATRCPYCSTGFLGTPWLRCGRCGHPCHEDCWSFNQTCPRQRCRARAWPPVAEIRSDLEVPGHPFTTQEV